MPIQEVSTSSALTVAAHMESAANAAATASTFLFTLPDNRTLSYSQFGAPNGVPVFFLHGWPGSRLDGAFFHAQALKHNVRLIAPDRPGIGQSTPKVGRTLLDHPKDLEALATHLNLDRYGVLGVSGGGPYAMACAYALPREKLKVVCNVTGLGEIPTMAAKGMLWPNWLGFRYLMQWFPRGMEWYIDAYWRGRIDSELSDEEKMARFREEISASQPGKKDLEAGVLDDGFLRFGARTSRVAFEQGVKLQVEDARLIGGAWGFRIEDVREDLKLQLWFGSQDSNVGGDIGEQIASRFPGEGELYVKDETHLSLQVNWMDEYIAALARAMNE